MRFILMPTLCLITLTVAIAAAQKSDSPVSNTIEAQRTVSIVWGNSTPDVAKRVVLRARSPENVDAVVANLLGAPPPAIGAFAAIDEVAAGDGITRLQVRVDLSGKPRPPMMAKEVAEALVARLREMLSAEAQGTLLAQLDAQRTVQASAQNRITEIEQEMDKLRKALREATGRIDVTPVDVRKEISSLEEQRQAATLALEQKQVRSDALAASIAKLSAEAEQRGKEDPVAGELEKVVVVKKQIVERLRQQHQSGTVADTEVHQAEAEAALAMAKLLERRQSMTSSIAGDTLPAWNRELLSLGIERAELEARVKLVSARLDRMATVVAELDRYDALVAQRDNAHHEMHAAEKDVRALKQHISTLSVPEAFVEDATQKSAQ